MVACWLAGSGCGGAPAVPPVPPRCCQFETAYDLVPDDVDIVVRLAWAQLRTGPFYEPARRSLVERSGDTSLVAVLERARTVLLGLRMMPDGVQGDGVIVIEGDGGDLLTRAQVEGMLGGSAVQWTEDAAAHSRLAIRTDRAQRWDRAAVWTLDGKAVVVATSVEADAVEHLARTGPEPRHLEVPARGLVSFAVRAPRGDWASTVREPLHTLAIELTQVRGALDVVGTEVRFEAELSYGLGAAAGSAADHLRQTLDRLSTLEAAKGAVGVGFREVRRRAQITAEGASLMVSLTVPMGWVARALDAGAP